MRKLNENCVKLNVSSIKRDYPTLKINTMRDQFINAGASVTSEERESSINEGADDLYMVVNSLNESTVLTMCESIGIEDPEYYLDEFDETDDDIEDDELEEDYDEDEVRETVEDVVNNMSAEELTAEDAEEYILDRVLEYFPYPKNHEDIVGIIKEVIAEALEAIDDNDTEEDDLEYPDYDEVDLDEEDTNEFDEALDDIDEDDEWDADDELNDYDEFDECIQEKKQSCCPPKKGKMVNLSESLKKLTISDILADVRKNVKLNESISNKALLKAKAAKLSSIKESLGIEKANLVISQVKARSPFLYENKKINGKFISEYTTNELLELLEKAKVKKSNTLNESADFSKVERLLTILDEELTYRLTIEKYLNEDDEDPFAMLSVDPKDDKKEETSEEKKDDKKEESSEEKKDDTVKVGVCIYQFNDNFMTLYRENIQKYFDELNAKGGTKYEVTIVDGQNDAANQAEQVNTFISQGVDALIVNLVQTSSEAIAKAIDDAGIPCVYINREIADYTYTDKTCYVGADARQSGTFQGQIVCDLADHGDINGDGKVSYIMIEGDPENSDAQYRTQFSVKALTDAGVKVECLDDQVGNWDQTKGQEICANALAKYGDKIEVVFCNNDAMALGAAAAIQAAGRTVGKDIYLLGVDALAECVEMVKAGTMTGTVLNDHIGQSHAAVDAAVQSLKGKIEKYYWVDYVMVK